MIQRALSIIATLILIAWLAIIFLGLPKGMHDPDGELGIALLVLLDLLILLVGIVLAVAAIRGKASFWVAIAVLAVPFMHLLGCFTVNPLDLVLFLFPAAVLPLIIVFKWRRIQPVKSG